MSDEQKAMSDALALFPLRVKDKEVTAVSLREGERGDSEYSPKDHVAKVPVGDNAYERTLRLHEALHAIYSNSRVPKTYVGQVAEDLRLHLNKSNLEGKPRRDEIRAAVDDLRSIVQAFKYALEGANPDALLGVFLRAVAILEGHTGWTPSSKVTRYSNLIKQAYSRLKCNDKSKLGQSLTRAFKDLKTHDSTARAASTLRKHFMDPERQPQKGGYGKGEPSGSNQQGYGIANPLIKVQEVADNDGGMEWMQGFGDHEFAKIKVPKKYIPREAHDRLIELSKANLIPTVRLHRLALTHPKKSKQESPKFINTYSGARIRAKRLAAAMTSPVPVRLFKRKRVKRAKQGVGGTILIDASGSMGIEDAQLDRLMELCPMGSIAYYDGVDDGATREAAKLGGDIVVIAERGKQADLEASRKHRPDRHGENQIDLQAMQWMMTHPKPWYFLTDGRFTGSCNYVAVETLKSLIHRGEVTRIVSYKSMINKLKDMADKLEG